MMPFFRLVAIYLAVFFVAFLIYNRESVMGMFESTPPEDLPPIPPIVSSEPAPAPAPSAAVQASETEPTPENEAMEQPVPSAEKTSTDQEMQAETSDNAPDQPAASPQGDMSARLEEARQAYWSGDITGSETLYKSLATDFSDEPDIHGELGNLYYSQRQFEKAAEAFHKAGALLIDAGNTAQAMSIIGVLQGMDPGKASDLRQKLAQ